MSIEIKNISLDINNKRILKNINLKVIPGEILSVVGPILIKIYIQYQFSKIIKNTLKISNNVQYLLNRNINFFGELKKLAKTLVQLYI